MASRRKKHTGILTPSHRNSGRFADLFEYLYVFMPFCRQTAIRQFLALEEHHQIAECNKYIASLSKTVRAYPDLFAEFSASCPQPSNKALPENDDALMQYICSIEIGMQQEESFVFEGENENTLLRMQYTSVLATLGALYRLKAAIISHDKCEQGIQFLNIGVSVIQGHTFPHYIKSRLYSSRPLPGPKEGFRIFFINFVHDYLQKHPDSSNSQIWNELKQSPCVKEVLGLTFHMAVLGNKLHYREDASPTLTSPKITKATMLRYCRSARELFTPENKSRIK